LTTAPGCDLLFHAAAVYATWSRNEAEVIRPAVEGAHNAFTAAKRHRVERVVYTSSTAAIGNTSERNSLRTSADWNDGAKNVYYRAKTASERFPVPAVWQLSPGEPAREGAVAR